jgi:biopolymer transport protein ExbB
MDGIVFYLASLVTGLRSFLETGGPVLLWIMGVTFCMWVLMIERIWYFMFSHPFVRRRAVRQWEARTDHRSWYAHKVREALISEVKAETHWGISMIKTFIALAPLFGLLGTVTGMVEVFDVMAYTGASNARAMASGVSKATIPTMAGMVAAISGLYLASILERTAKRETEKIADALELR